MSPSLPASALVFILLVELSGATPVSDPQSLERTLGSLEEAQEAQRAEEVLLGAQLDSSNSALQKDGVLMRLLKDLMRTSKRSWSRYKKGGLRSCFGVRLARIGSFSGLGC